MESKEKKDQIKTGKKNLKVKSYINQIKIYKLCQQEKLAK